MENQNALKAKSLYEQGNSLSNIASILGVSAGTVRSWKNRYKWGTDAATQRNIEKVKRNATVIAVADKTLSERLTEKERLFCEIYVMNFNATQAAIKAGYSVNSARGIGYENLTKQHIRAYIEELKKSKKAALMINEDDIVERYMRIAFADMTDFVEFGRTEIQTGFREDKDTGEMEPVTAEVNEIRFKDSSVVDGGLICQIKQGRDGASVKLEDRQKALDWLSNFFCMNPMDKHRVDYDNKRLKLEAKKVDTDENKDKNGGVTIIDDV